MANRYFADTYALVEILRGSPSYASYASAALYTTEFNLLELAYALVRDFDRRTARKVLSSVRSSIVLVSADDFDFIRAAQLRISARRDGKNLSLIGCLGYVIADRLDVPFLTGDREFRGMGNVEYVR